MLNEHYCQFIGFGEEDTDRWCSPGTPSESRACGKVAKFEWFYHAADCKTRGKDCGCTAEAGFYVCADHWDQLVDKLQEFQLRGV